MLDYFIFILYNLAAYQLTSSFREPLYDNNNQLTVANDSNSNKPDEGFSYDRPYRDIMAPDRTIDRSQPLLTSDLTLKLTGKLPHKNIKAVY